METNIFAAALGLPAAVLLCVQPWGSAQEDQADPPQLEQRWGGLHGYIAMDVSRVPEGYGYGASFYASIWPLIDTPISGFQIGLPSTWIIPENRGFTEPLCPPGTYARDHWPERGPTYGDVFQTIEGGLGYWASTRFPSATPKFRINGTTNCYSHEISSVGWGFGDPVPLGEDQMGLAQLSNRLVVAPDGLTFREDSDGEVFGAAWMALPLTDFEGWYRLRLGDGEGARYLTFEPEGCRLAARNEGVSQLWRIDPSDFGGVRLQARSGDGLEACLAMGSPPRLVPRGEGPVQRWRLIATESTGYRIESLTNAAGPRALDATVLGGGSDEHEDTWELIGQATEDSTPTGDKAWTLFANAANFKGPVAFYIPRAWSQVSRGYPAIAGRGLDARPGVMGSGAMEVNTVPMFEARDARGVRYTRIPALGWPVDEAGQSWLMQDVTMYSSQALYGPTLEWFQGGAELDGRFDAAGAHQPTCTSGSLGLRQRESRGNESAEFAGMDEIVGTIVFEGESCAYGLQWGAGAPEGRFPEYFREVEGEAVPVAAAEVPAETGLTEAVFAPPHEPLPYTSPAEPQSAWMNPGPARGPFHIELNDGSVLTYSWYRFVDQPSLACLGLDEPTKARLQARAERVHAAWSEDRDYMPPPTRGELAVLEPQQIVSPPEGLEIGYVPVVTRQEARP